MTATISGVCHCAFAAICLLLNLSSSSLSFAVWLRCKLQHSSFQKQADLLLWLALNWHADKHAHGFWSHKQAWALGVAACLTGAFIGAAVMLGAEAYAAKVQRSLNTNIEQYQTLQGGNQV